MSDDSKMMMTTTKMSRL